MVAGFVSRFACIPGFVALCQSFARFAHLGGLHPQLSRVFVEYVECELSGKVIGDGVVFRACAKVLKESGMFDPPELDSGRMPRVSKWDR